MFDLIISITIVWELAQGQYCGLRIDVNAFARSNYCVSSGCDHMKILSCTIEIRQEVAVSKFVKNIKQLNSYCDKIAMAHL